MLFNSYIFIFAFLPVSFFIYFYLNQKGFSLLGKGFLIFCSLFFYAWWNPIYLPIILSSMLFNFLISRSLNIHIKNTDSYKKLLLFMGIAFNLTLLAFFKYADFFIENINFVTSSDIPTWNLVLPLAISFFTFQQIAYLVDTYRGESKEYDFLNYALFVTFFPQLIAGPIVHHKEMIPQFASKINLVKNYFHIALGLFIFSIGLFKKVVIADTFATWATNGFDIADKLYFIEAWITSLSYTFQLYFDFSGYTDMAIGAALLFNIKLPFNFNSPYKAVSIQDFWRRWHMTLSRFLKEYIYIPLGGNRLSPKRTYLNLLATFFLAGLWHGAGWTFIAWGLLHGFALIVHRAWAKTNIKIPTLFAWFLTFNFINLSWVFFRAESFDDIVKVISGMIGFNGVLLPGFLQKNLSEYNFDFLNFGGFLSSIQGDITVFFWLILAFIIVFLFKNSNYFHKTFKANTYYSLFFMFISVVSVLKLSGYSEFLYFRF